MSWLPRPGWVLVEPIDTEETFRGGTILIPQASRDRTAQWQYTVLAAGEPLELDEDADPETPSRLSVGDWVLAKPRAAVHVEEESIWLLPERDIWGRLSS